MYKTLLLAVATLTGSVVSAQQFGGHPPSTRWRQVNTDSVRVIFPAGLERTGQEVAGIVHRIGQQPQGLLGKGFRKISIVLQPNTTISNGYVGLGPWRSEFYLTPPQNSFTLGSLQWHQSLALHEYRHVEQYSNFRKGISKLAYILFGEQAQELVNSAAIPNWFWEGDAVYQETILSQQGRGRVPAFFNDYRSLWAANKKYSWMKLRNGSLRDFVPDHYRLGYMMVAYGREKYGNDIWAKITDDAARFNGLFYPFQRAVKKYTGESYRQFRTNAMAHFSNSFKDSLSDVEKFAATQKHFVGDIAFPQFLDDHTLVYVKSSFKKLPAFMVRDLSNGNVKQLRIKDISLDASFSLRNGKIVYAAYEPDIRWNWHNYSVIKWLDVKSNEQRTLTHRSQYFSPDISEDGNRIVAVKVEPGQTSSLHLISSADGSVISELPNKEAYFFTYPKFFGSNAVITAARNNKGEMALLQIDLSNGSQRQLTPFTYNVIGFPAVHKDTIVFTASQGRLDRIFMMVQNKLYRLNPAQASRYTGQYMPQMAHGQYVYTAVTAVGDRLQQATIAENELQPVTETEFAQAPVSYDVNEMQAGKFFPVEAAAGDTGFAVSRYSKGFRLFNFHSWRPFVDDPDYTLSIIGENVLNTLQSEVYFNYNNNERNKEVGVNFTYAQLFPWIRLGSNYTFDRPFTFRNQQLYFCEWNSSAGLLVPLNLSRGRFNTNLTVGADIAYKKQYVQGSMKNAFNLKGFSFVRPYISFVNQVQTARMHILPRWGQNIRLTYNRAISTLDANQFLASGYWYFPGLVPTHNLVINTAFQKRDTLERYIFSNSFPFSRGYNGVSYPQMWKLGANYHLPLLYPDFGVANIVYLLRVRANLFYDHTNGKFYNKGKSYTDELRSYGTEIYFDTKWWNQHNVTFGFRYSRLMDGDVQRLNANQWEFIMPVNLLGSR